MGMVNEGERMLIKHSSLKAEVILFTGLILLRGDIMILKAPGIHEIDFPLSNDVTIHFVSFMFYCE